MAALFGFQQRWWVAVDRHVLCDIGASGAMLTKAHIARELERHGLERILRSGGARS